MPKLPRWTRIALLVAGLVAMAAAADAAGWTESASVDGVRAALEAAGPLGALGFVAAFAAGSLLSIPGMIFVVASLLAYGKVVGLAVAVVGALVSLSVNFWVARLVGGQPAGELKAGWAQRAMAGLERHPVRTIFLLRNVFILSPVLNYALAFSPVRYRDYLAGSALGVIAPIAVYAAALDCVVAAGWV